MRTLKFNQSFNVLLGTPNQDMQKSVNSNGTNQKNIKI